MTRLQHLFEYVLTGVARFVVLFEHVLVGAALSLPLVWAALIGLVHWRLRRGQTARQAWAWSLAEIGMVVGTVPWLVMGMWPMDIPSDTVRWRLEPFADIATQLSGPPEEAFIQIVANMLVFFALGVFGPVRFTALGGPARLLGLGMAASLTLELCQQVFGTGRVFSVDDILLNGFGCLIGGLLSWRWWASRSAPQGTDPVGPTGRGDGNTCVNSWTSL